MKRAGETGSSGVQRRPRMSPAISRNAAASAFSLSMATLPRQPRGRLPILNVCGFLELVEKPFNPSVDAFSSHQDSVPLLRPHRTKPSTKNNNDLGTERVGKESCYGEQLVWVGSGVGVPDTALR